MTATPATKINPETITMETEVWVASYGWRDCDPVGTLMAFDRQVLADALDSAMQDELDSAQSGEEDALDESDLVWYGDSREKLATLITPAELAEVARDLAESGVAYLSR